jgi:hypothetical protein
LQEFLCGTPCPQQIDLKNKIMVIALAFLPSPKNSRTQTEQQMDALRGVLTEVVGLNPALVQDSPPDDAFG